MKSQFFFSLSVLVFISVAFVSLSKHSTTTPKNSSSVVNPQLAVYLEGPYIVEEGVMSTKLNLDPEGNLKYRGILPGQKKVGINNPWESVTPPYQPYNTSQWNHQGTEGQTDGPPWYYAPGSQDPEYAVYHPDIVDWVLVRFREGDTPIASLVIGAAAAFVLKDGTVVFPFGVTLGSSPSTVWVQIDHRNHMAVLTPMAIPLDGGSPTWDFRTQDSYATTTSFGQKQIVPGVWGMFAGDSDQESDFPNYDITGIDNILWSSQNGQSDKYSQCDYNFDASTDGIDKVYWSVNNGISSHVPDS